MKKVNYNPRYERFLQAYADANPLLSKQAQQKNAKALWCEVNNDSKNMTKCLEISSLKKKRPKLNHWKNGLIFGHNVGELDIICVLSFCKKDQTICR